MTVHIEFIGIDKRLLDITMPQIAVIFRNRSTAIKSFQRTIARTTGKCTGISGYRSMDCMKSRQNGFR